MQDVSITVLNVTLNDSGIYTCNITREFEFEIHRPLFTSSRLIHLTVVEEGTEDWQTVLCPNVPWALSNRDIILYCIAGEGGLSSQVFLCQQQVLYRVQEESPALFFFLTAALPWAQSACVGKV